MNAAGAREGQAETTAAWPGPALAAQDLPGLKFGPDGLVPVVAQDHVTGAVLMLAWADEEALGRSLDTGRMTYWSRSRKTYWVKGEESGHAQHLRSLHADCDGDAVLAFVEQEGPACHTGAATCWSGAIDQAGADATRTNAAEAPVASFLGVLERIVAARARDAPAGSYTARLLADPALAAAKVVEEADEVARVLRGEANEDSLEHEAADLLYHLVVALRGQGIGVEAVLRELAERHSTG